MKENIIAKQYAESLLAAAQETNDPASVKTDLENFLNTVMVSEDFFNAIQSPAVPEGRKSTLVKALAEKTCTTPLSSRFLELLLQRKRLTLLEKITTWFALLVEEVEGRTTARVTTAFPLGPEDKKKILARCSAITGKQVELIVQEDQSLLGGAVVHIGNRVYDGSIKGQLDSLKSYLTS